MLLPRLASMIPAGLKLKILVPNSLQLNDLMTSLLLKFLFIVFLFLVVLICKVSLTSLHHDGK
jgi:hypothetical protein